MSKNRSKKADPTKGLENGTQESGLGAYAEAADKFVTSLKLAQDSFKDMATIYNLHIDDIKMIDVWKDKCTKAEAEFQHKESEVEGLKKALYIVKNIGFEEKSKQEQDRAQLERDQEKLKKDRESFEKRLKTQAAQDEENLRIEREKLRKEHDAQVNKTKSQLEKEYKEKNTASEQKVLKVVEELRSVSKKRDELDRKREKLEFELETMTQAKKTVDQDNKSLEDKLDKLELSLNVKSQGESFYVEKFADIHRQVQLIPREFLCALDDLEPADLDSITKRIGKRDEFKDIPIPISASPESKLLCLAHMQRVLASHLMYSLWCPFMSPATFQTPTVLDLLDRLSEAVEGQCEADSRNATMWRVQTIKALQALPQGFVGPGVSMARENKFLDGIDKALLPLVEPSQKINFRSKLRKLYNDAIALWDLAQTDGLAIQVEPILEPHWYGTCRSQTFENDAQLHDNMPSFIMVLFPRITAQSSTHADNSSADSGISGIGGQAQRIVLHPGEGLSDSCQLVEEGKQEVKMFEQAQKDLRRNFSMDRSRRQSAAGSITNLWNGGRSPITEV